MGITFSNPTEGAAYVPQSRRLRPQAVYLDTNVLLHDPTSLFKFKEHDLYIPIITLEEMDAHKKGMSDVARNARQASRFSTKMINAGPHLLSSGIPLSCTGRSEAQGKLRAANPHRSRTAAREPAHWQGRRPNSSP